MADDKRVVINEWDPETVELSLPKGFAQGVGWEVGASFHVEKTERGFRLVRDERPV